MTRRLVSLPAPSILAISFLLIAILQPVAIGENQTNGDQTSGKERPSPTAGAKTQTSRNNPAASPLPRLCAACIRAHMEFLASDAMRGRGSGTADELLAAT